MSRIVKEIILSYGQSLSTTARHHIGLRAAILNFFASVDIRQMLVKGQRAFWLIVLGLISAGVQANPYPTKPVRLIVAFPAGGGLDITARLLAQKLSQYWGQPVVTENRPGASGIIGADVAAKSPKDGYTLLMGSPAETAINLALYPKMTYNPLTDFAPVSLVAKFPLLIVVNDKVSANSMKELTTLAHNTTGGLPFASSGIGSMQQLVGEWLKHNADVDFFHVPYKGTGPALNDLLGGQIPSAIMGLAPLIPNIKAGKIRGIAVTSNERNPAVPNIPTLREQGIDFESTIWFGVFAPAGTPSDIVQKINKDIRHVLADPSVKKQVAILGGEPVSSSPDEFTAFIKTEYAKYSKIIKDSNIKVD